MTTVTPDLTRGVLVGTRQPRLDVSVDTDDALDTDDAVGLAQRLRRREVSAAELAQAATARAHAVNSALNAVATWVDDVAPSPGDSPFAGVPSLVKDNEDLHGYPTTQGSLAVPDARARADSPWVDQFRTLGFVPIAKTTLPEFGLTASTESTRFGATRNPWDTDRSAGGSSGGSAALVAAGVVPLAHANDGGGSIRIPASCCGLVGLKPSRGRLVDRPEMARLPVPMTVQGVVTRTVRDTAAYYAAAERAHRNSRLPPIGDVHGPAPARLRIGLVLDPPHGIAVDSDVVDRTAHAARALADLGHHVEPIAPPGPHRFGPDFLVYWQMLALGLRLGGHRLFGRRFDPTRTEPLTDYLAERMRIDLPRLPGALTRLRRCARRGEAVYDTLDVVLSPVLAHPPPAVGHCGPGTDPRTHVVRLLRWTAFTPLANVDGAPALSMPWGHSREGAPIGVQLAAPLGQEARLLHLAYELESASPGPNLLTRQGMSPGVANVDLLG
ncbi:MAG: amidase [Jiangellales bacterium]